MNFSQLVTRVCVLAGTDVRLGRVLRGIGFSQCFGLCQKVRKVYCACFCVCLCVCVFVCGHAVAEPSSGFVVGVGLLGCRLPAGRGRLLGCLAGGGWGLSVVGRWGRGVGVFLGVGLGAVVWWGLGAWGVGVVVVGEGRAGTVPFWLELLSLAFFESDSFLPLE